jgi:hypothetical protein
VPEAVAPSRCGCAWTVCVGGGAGMRHSAPHPACTAPTLTPRPQHIFVSAVQTTSCGSSTLAYASSCQRDQQDRPIFATINYCPNYLPATAATGSDAFNFVLAVSNHEIFHGTAIWPLHLRWRYSPLTVDSPPLICLPTPPTLSSLHSPWIRILLLPSFPGRKRCPADASGSHVPPSCVLRQRATSNVHSGRYVRPWQPWPLTYTHPPMFTETPTGTDHRDTDTLRRHARFPKHSTGRNSRKLHDCSRHNQPWVHVHRARERVQLPSLHGDAHRGGPCGEVARMRHACE